MTAAGAAAGEELIVVTSRGELTIDDIPIKNFRPIGEFELPEYELQKLSFPPILQILDYVQREQFTEIIISTPGPIGLTGLLAAKMLNLRTSGIYHTDFPEYIRILTEDRFLESLAWTLHALALRPARHRLRELGAISAKLDRARVRAGKTEDSAARARYRPVSAQRGAIRPFGKHSAPPNGDQVRLLYVGRISQRKRSRCSGGRLSAAYAMQVSRCSFSSSGTAHTQRRWPKRCPTPFLPGYLAGEELAKAYASADIFVFPSTTDTFGNVIIEAQASGLPVVVSDSGRPERVGGGQDQWIDNSGRTTSMILPTPFARWSLILHCASAWAIAPGKA